MYELNTSGPSFVVYSVTIGQMEVGLCVMRQVYDCHSHKTLRLKF